MSTFSKLVYSFISVVTISIGVFATGISAQAKAVALQADNNYNVVVSRYADLAIRYKAILADPYYIPANEELSDDRKKLATSSLNNGLFVFSDKNGDPLFRISIIPKDYKLGDSIDGLKSVKGMKGAILKSYFTTDALNQISKVVVYYVPASRQAEFKATTIVRFSTSSGRIYSLSLYRAKVNPGVKIQFNSLAESKENLIRKELSDQNRVEFYK